MSTWYQHPLFSCTVSMGVMAESLHLRTALLASQGRWTTYSYQTPTPWNRSAVSNFQDLDHLMLLAGCPTTNTPVTIYQLAEILKFSVIQTLQHPNHWKNLFLKLISWNLTMDSRGIRGRFFHASWHDNSSHLFHEKVTINFIIFY